MSRIFTVATVRRNLSTARALIGTRANYATRTDYQDALMSEKRRISKYLATAECYGICHELEAVERELLAEVSYSEEIIAARRVFVPKPTASLTGWEKELALFCGRAA